MSVSKASGSRFCSLWAKSSSDQLCRTMIAPCRTEHVHLDTLIFSRTPEQRLLTLPGQKKRLRKETYLFRTALSLYKNIRRFVTDSLTKGEMSGAALYKYGWGRA